LVNQPVANPKDIQHELHEGGLVHEGDLAVEMLHEVIQGLSRCADKCMELWVVGKFEAFTAFVAQCMETINKKAEFVEQFRCSVEHILSFLQINANSG
jgi:hypothetical protein